MLRKASTLAHFCLLLSYDASTDNRARKKNLGLAVTLPGMCAVFLIVRLDCMQRLQLRQSRTVAFQTGKACQAWKHSAETLAQLIPEDHRLCVICLDGVDEAARFVNMKCIRCTCVMHARCFRFKDDHPDCPQCRGKFFPAPLSSYVASSMASL